MGKKRLMIIIASAFALTVLLVGLNWTPIALRYHYHRMTTLRHRELQTGRGVLYQARRNELHLAYMRHRDLLVQAGYRIEEKRVIFHYAAPIVLYGVLKRQFPDLDFAIPSGRQCVVVYGSPEVTREAERFIIEHDVKADQTISP